VHDVAAVRVDELEQVYREVCSGYGRLLQLVAKADEEQDGLLLGCTGTAALLVSRLRVTRTVAAGMVSEARGLRRCPETLARLADGRIDPGHLRQILAGVKAVAHVPEGPEKAEEILLALALEQDAGAVKIAAAGIKQALDPIGVEREHRARRERSVCYLSPTLDGMWNLAGTLDAESGAMVATALDALSTGYLHAEEEPATEQASQAERKDRLSGPQRRALALADLAARALTAGEVGVHGGTRPHLSVLIPEQVLTDAPTPSIATAATTAYGQALPPSSPDRRRRAPTESRPYKAAGHHRSTQGPRHPRQGLHAPGVSNRPAVVRRSPHRLLAGRRRHRLGQPHPSLPTAPYRRPLRAAHSRSDRAIRTRRRTRPRLLISRSRARTSAPASLPRDPRTRSSHVSVLGGDPLAKRRDRAHNPGTPTSPPNATRAITAADRPRHPTKSNPPQAIEEPNPPRRKKRHRHPTATPSHLPIASSPTTAP